MSEESFGNIAILLDGPDAGKTPSSKEQQTSVSEMPSVSSVQADSSTSGSFESQTSTIVRGFGGEIVEVKLGYFFTHILPSLPNNVDVPTVVDSLKNAGHIVKERWAAFEKNPSEDDRHESVVFQPLVQVFDSIITTASPLLGGAEQTLILKLDPKNAPSSEGSRQLKPDGVFPMKNRTSKSPTSLCKDPAETEPVRGPNKSKDSWHDIVATAAFKETAAGKDDVSSQLLFTLVIMLKVYQNVLQILNCIQHTMAVDPRRRSMFGMTIEDTSARLWFCCRAVVFVTECFDFMKASTSSTFWNFGKCANDLI